mmetsp:Transcript_101446/g.282649  ORF Transcript_101446/g.282649 Transcript_101446/m.282649 type:complete len:210 (-) Transcript_101446:142-771(-)
MLGSRSQARLLPLSRHLLRSSGFSSVLRTTRAGGVLRVAAPLMGSKQSAGMSSGSDSKLPFEGSMDAVPLKKSEAEWREKLTATQYKILREKGTERAGTGEYDGYYPKKGYFACAACDAPLYSAEAKFKSGCGWPAFDKCYKGAIITTADDSLFMRRVEIMCANCGGHMGHVFEGERMTPTNERHCVNSVSIKFVDKAPPEGLEEAKVV